MRRAPFSLGIRIRGSQNLVDVIFGPEAGAIRSLGWCGHRVSRRSLRPATIRESRCTLRGPSAYARCPHSVERAEVLESYASPEKKVRRPPQSTYRGTARSLRLRSLPFSSRGQGAPERTDASALR